jgi:hypothetical protein
VIDCGLTGKSAPEPAGTAAVVHGIGGDGAELKCHYTFTQPDPEFRAAPSQIPTSSSFRVLKSASRRAVALRHPWRREIGLCRPIITGFEDPHRSPCHVKLEPTKNITLGNAGQSQHSGPPFSRLRSSNTLMSSLIIPKLAPFFVQVRVKPSLDHLFDGDISVAWVYTLVSCSRRIPLGSRWGHLVTDGANIFKGSKPSAFPRSAHYPLHIA